MRLVWRWLRRRSRPGRRASIPPTTDEGLARLGLVGCVKQKASSARPAEQLYTSALFRGRRRYVEQSCERWLILSAAHGVVEPDEILEPYDDTLTSASTADRRAWAQGVLERLDELGVVGETVIVEIHAGAEYRDHGLVEGLEARGCHVEVPTGGMRIGEQLRWYKEAGSGVDAPPRAAAAQPAGVAPAAPTSRRPGARAPSRLELLDRFYELLDELEAACGGKRRLADCTGAMDWPARGVYFFFEPGEVRADGRPRVVRVGTHALRPSRSTLWKRLSQHRGTVSGQHAGGGNHRGSIFRLHVGTALLATGEWPTDVAGSWGAGSTASPAQRAAELPLERAVTAQIGAMPFLWLAVDDPPSAASERGVIERQSIGLLSNRGRRAVDPPSPTWLGRHADRAAVRESGLWNVNHVDDPAPTDLAALERWVRA